MKRNAVKAYPQCEVCWIDENSDWEPHSVTQDGKIVARMRAIAVPVELSPSTVQVCCSCGELTVVGLFVDKHPSEVKFDVDPDDIVERDLI